MSKIPTIQEAFIEIYYKQDQDFNNQRKYIEAREVFINLYNLQPPYSSYGSFLYALYSRDR